MTGRKTLSEETGLSEQEIRTSIDILKNAQFLTSKSTNKFTIYLISKYEEYQEYLNTLLTSKSTNEQPATNQQVTTPNKDNKDNKDNKEDTADRILKIFNKTFNKEFKTYKSFIRNLIYWCDIYSEEDIIKAIKKAKTHHYWKDKLTPLILFRQKNPRGEDVDYIGELIEYSQIPDKIALYTAEDGKNFYSDDELNHYIKNKLYFTQTDSKGNIIKIIPNRR